MTEPFELRDVSKSYGETRVVSDISLRFEPGSIHGVVGPNGAGKTTVFRILLGLTRPDAGRVVRPDVSVGCSFQTPKFYPDLTVRENLDLFTELVDGSAAWRDTLIDRCGLDRVVHRRSGDISAGFKKRLDIAIALLDRPAFVVLDEPLADVDDAYRSQLRALFDEYASADRIVLVATHQFEWFEPLFDTLTVLVDGQVRFSDDIVNADLEAPGDIVTLYRNLVDPSREG